MESYTKLKTDLTLCAGQRKGDGYPCNGTLYKCKNCGNVGGRQTKSHICSHQGFSVSFHCLKCGASDQQEVVH